MLHADIITQMSWIARVIAGIAARDRDVDGLIYFYVQSVWQVKFWWRNHGRISLGYGGQRLPYQGEGIGSIGSYSKNFFRNAVSIGVEDECA
jgi:hypothetical protein